MASLFGPSQGVSDPTHWLVRALGGGKTKAGVAVSEWTALHLPAVYACVNRIANPIGHFPLGIYRRDRKGKRKQVMNHPLSRRLGVRPNEFMSSRTLRKTVQSHALTWGNGYLEIERNGLGQSVNLWPLPPHTTRPAYEEGERFFRTTIDGVSHRLPYEDVIHIMDLSQNGFVGHSQIWLARQALGLAFATEEFGSKFFANDAKSGGFLMHPGKLSAAAQGNLQGGPKRQGERDDPGAALQRQGGLENAHRVKVLEEGMKWIQTTIPPEDAQFLATREFQIAEIARIFDVPLVLLQSHEKSTSWGSGIEQLMIGFVTQTIAPWVECWEQELNWKLFTPEERDRGYYVKFNMNAILRGDMAARGEFYAKLFGVGGITPNQICALEDFDDMGADGDHHFVQGGYVPMKHAINPPPAPIGHNGGPSLSDDETAPAPAEGEEEAA